MISILKNWIVNNGYVSTNIVENTEGNKESRIGGLLSAKTEKRIEFEIKSITSGKLENVIFRFNGKNGKAIEINTAYIWI